MHRVDLNRGRVRTGFQDAIYDVLSLVFVQTVEQWEIKASHFSKLDPPWGSLYKDIISIMGVCKHWRATILDTPRVWVNMIYDSNDPVNRKVRYFEASHCFSRSGAIPIHLWLKNDCGPANLTILLSRFVRDQHVSLKSLSIPFGTGWILPVAIRDTVKAAFASVRSLTLYSSNISVQQNSASFCGLLSLFLDLRCLNLRGIRFLDRADIQCRRTYFAFPRVRYLSVESTMQGVQHALFLLQCPNLHELLIKVKRVDDDDLSFPIWQSGIVTRASRLALSGHVTTAYMTMIFMLVPEAQAICLHDFHYCGRESYEDLRQLANSVREQRLVPFARTIELFNIQPCFVWIALALRAKGKPRKE